MGFDPRYSKFLAWLNAGAALITVVGLIGSYTERTVLGPLQKNITMPVWTLLVAAIFISSFVIIVVRRLKPQSGDSFGVLLKLATHPELVRIVDQTGKEFVGGHADNFYWKEVADALCNGLSRTDLRYSNMGEFYQLRDLATGNVLSIPTDNRLEDKITSTGIRNGQVLMVVQKQATH